MWVATVCEVARESMRLEKEIMKSRMGFAMAVGMDALLCKHFSAQHYDVKVSATSM